MPRANPQNLLKPSILLSFFLPDNWGILANHGQSAELRVWSRTSQNLIYRLNPYDRSPTQIRSRESTLNGFLRASEIRQKRRRHADYGP